MIIKLVRHARSLANEGIVIANVVGDHNVDITDDGWLKSVHLGKQLAPFMVSCLKYRSPYKRTRRTLDGMMEGFHQTELSGLLQCDRIYEDPRLREVEWGLGNGDPEYWEKVERMKEEYGSFYVRRPGGESCADCYDRCAAFIGTMMRQIGRKLAKNVLIVSHGLTIRCLVASFMHLTVEEFELLRNPLNLDVITIQDTPPTAESNIQFTCGRWGVEGLRLSRNTI